MTSNAVSSGIAITQIGQIAINVLDTSRAVEFYRDTLGLKLLFHCLYEVKPVRVVSTY